MTYQVGAHGEAIGDLHQRLIEAGFTVEQGDLSSEIFGEATASAVRAFQATHGLAVDGVAGPRTLAMLYGPGDRSYYATGWRVDPAAARTLVRGVLIEAAADIGRREQPDGSNNGPELAKFDTRGASWCALAVSTWYRAAPGGCPWGRMSSGWDIRDWAEAHGRLLDPNAPLEPGDVAIVLRANRRSHVALVAHVLPIGALCTIAGNESNAVRGRVRPRAAFTAFVRPLPGGEA